VNANNLEILQIYFGNGNEHDFQMLKDSKILDIINIDTLIKADSGYQGIKNLHAKSEIPFKANKNHELTEEEKEYNHILSKKRIFIEHVNRYIKIFRIAKETYRNKGNRHQLRINLIGVLYNKMLPLAK
jgi:IS5 family transposase